MDNSQLRRELAGKQSYGMDDLIAIMALLRAPDGCPWDREQTHESIRSNLIEETYEAVEAIDAGDPSMLREELGDVLLQVVFHSRLSEEAGEFDFAAVVNEVCAKLVLRHPHIFGDVKVKDTSDVLKNWDAIKQDSKGRTTLAEKLEGVSKALPALMRADKLVRKASKADAALTAEKIKAPAADDMSEEAVGDRLLAAAGEAALRGVDSERALSDACERFIAALSERGL